MQVSHIYKVEQYQPVKKTNFDKNGKGCHFMVNGHRSLKLSIKVLFFW